MKCERRYMKHSSVCTESALTPTLSLREREKDTFCDTYHTATHGESFPYCLDRGRYRRTLVAAKRPSRLKS